MWNKSIEDRLCAGMGYPHCILFSAARVAIGQYRTVTGPYPVFLPSNICPALANAMGHAIYLPVSEETGLARTTNGISVQLYGYWQTRKTSLIIDPLLAGWGQERKSNSIIVSFGYGKTIDIGGGGAILTDLPELYYDLKHLSDFPNELVQPLTDELERLPANIATRQRRRDWWDKYLGDCCIKPPLEQAIPWRVIRRIPGRRDDVVKALRWNSYYDAGTNYPPLPGCTDPSSVKWGKQVINLWTTEDYDEDRIRAACEIIKRTIG